MPVRRADDVIGDGSLIVQNVDGEPVTILAVEPTTAPQAGLTVVGSGVVVLAPADSAGFVTRTFPPKLPQSYRFQAFNELVLQPSAQSIGSYEIFIGLRLGSPGTVTVTALTIRYAIAGHEYTQTFDHHMTLCLGRSAGASSCY